MADGSGTSKLSPSDEVDNEPSTVQAEEQPSIDDSKQSSRDESSKAKQPAATAASKSASVVNKLMAIPHIVTSILRHARQDRPSLARLMRTNKNMYLAAGPILYHTAAIWEETIDSFFDGSYKRCYCADCKKSAKDKWGIDHDNDDLLTAYGKLTQGPHGYGKYTNPPPREPQAEGKKKKKGGNNKKKNKKKKKAKKTTEEGATAADAADTKDKAKGKARKSSEVVLPGEPESTLPLSKRQLLAHVRILTLGGHHESACEIYPPHAAKYLVNLEVLRVVETPHNPFQTFHICENIPGGSCPMIDSLAPRKLVVRNISGLALPFDPLWVANPKTEEIVFVLPTELAAYAGKKRDGPHELMNSLVGQFNEANALRIVFWDGWDRSLANHPLSRKSYTDEEAAKLRADNPVRALHVDDVASILYKFTRTRRTKMLDMHRPRVEVYGLGAVQLSTHGHSPLVDKYKAANPGKKVDLHTIAKTKAMRCEIGLAMFPGGEKPILLGPCFDITWFTLNNYKRKEFAAEISEWD